MLNKDYMKPLFLLTIQRLKEEKAFYMAQFLGENKMNDILKLLNQKPIAYYPIYRQITGSVTAGIVLSQLMYWFSKKDEIYKTDKQMMKETFLSADELRSAKKKLKKVDFIEITRRGIPAKTYYKIYWDLYQTSLGNLYQSSLGNIPKQDNGKSTNRVKGNSLNSAREITLPITETTAETTTESKNIIKNLDLNFKLLIDELQNKAPRKSLIKFSPEAKKNFQKINDNWEVVRDNYLRHQTKEGKWSKRFDNFILDYDACISDLTATKRKANTNKTSTQDAIDRVFGECSNNEVEVGFFDAKVIER